MSAIQFLRIMLVIIILVSLANFYFWLTLGHITLEIALTFIAIAITTVSTFVKYNNFKNHEKNNEGQ